MKKEELLGELLYQVRAGEISRDEVWQILGEESEKVTNPAKSAFSVTKLLYILGAVIVVIGLFTFMDQVWDYLGSLERIGVTFVLGLLMALLGSVLLKQETGHYMGAAFHMIGGLLIPGGAAITLSELGVSGDWTTALVFLGIFIFYVVLNSIHKHPVLTFFTIFNGTVTAYLFLNAVVGGPFQGWFGVREIYQYMTMVIGASYLLLAHSFYRDYNHHFVGLFNFFGSLGLLAAAFSQVYDSVPWQLFYFLLLIGFFLLSIYLHSRVILVMSTIFLIIHVSFITAEYFAGSIGWPLSLIILGFVFIGFGYLSITINRNYLK